MNVENKRPRGSRGRVPQPYCHRTEQEESYTSSPEDASFDQKSLHPASLRASGLFVTLCAFSDDAMCFYRLKERLSKPLIVAVPALMIEPTKQCDRLVASLLDGLNGLEATLKEKTETA